MSQHPEHQHPVLAVSTALALLLAAAPASGDASTDHAFEYRVKAVFLERFARFVEWPAAALGDRDPYFHIVVLGDDPFHGELETAYQSREIRGRPVAVHHVRRVQDLGPCHLLFISASAAPQLEAVLKQLAGHPVLLVGDRPGFGEAGVHINFFVAEGNVRFEINAAALRSAGLSVSYLLLQVARLVGPAEEPR